MLSQYNLTRRDPVEVSTFAAELVFADGDPALAAEPTNKAKKYIENILPSVLVKVLYVLHLYAGTFTPVTVGRGISQTSAKPRAILAAHGFASYHATSLANTSATTHATPKT